MTDSPLAEYDSRIAVLQEQIAPLRAQVRDIAAERAAYADLLARAKTQAAA